VLDSGRDLPQGVEFSPVDTSALGDASKVTVTKTQAKAPVQGADSGHGKHGHGH
jgi:hypothetical protein